MRKLAVKRTAFSPRAVCLCTVVFRHVLRRCDPTTKQDATLGRNPKPIRSGKKRRQDCDARQQAYIDRMLLGRDLHPDGFHVEASLGRDVCKLGKCWLCHSQHSVSWLQGFASYVSIASSGEAVVSRRASASWLGSHLRAESRKKGGRALFLLCVDPHASS